MHQKAVFNDVSRDTNVFMASLILKGAIMISTEVA